MRSPKAVAADIALHDAVVEELRLEPRVDASRIRVAAKDGAIVLSGSVTSYPQRSAAVRAAERIHGVQAVADDIQVVLSTSVERRDAELAAEIARERGWNTAIPDSVDIDVRNGIVTLSGDVEWAYERDDAVQAVRHLQGVRGVANQIEVRPRAETTAEVERRIADAFARMADVDARSISVTASDGGVRLEGRVRSLAARQLAERAAASAPGVDDVDNDIEVTQ